MHFDMNAGSAKRRLGAVQQHRRSGHARLGACLGAASRRAAWNRCTVSSSRIQSSGFDAPTPTTVISADDLDKQANANVFTTITQLPSLMGSTGTTVGNGGSSNGVNGLSALNLRGLGTQRNLIMIDGERIIPTNSRAWSISANSRRC